MTKSLEEFKYFLTDDIYLIRESNDPVPLEADAGKAVKAEIESPVTGNIEGKVLVVVNLPLNESHAGLLVKIMKAVKIQSEELAYIDMKKVDQLDHEAISSKYILIFGNLSDHKLLPHQKYEAVNLNNKTILWSEDLATLEADINQKKQLWSALQNTFNVQ